ncbi:MAG TPA: hypothetical protein VNM69_05545 [Bacillus sp. (in: firmicutes)]|uniref:sulfotransferase family protein n=1 Tax=Bacillus litorisediminis TaxID=2922713 RepID=UPI001FAED623|nr:hypothetical protein [Bacillus litorisediminis]HWO75371.1 hypothetical protein [Bacillus sp. (in: firmicutes)]
MIHKKVVCVLGMHRSGTSAITRALNLMGISLGETDKLMEPGIDNPKGYWENTEIVDIHDSILELFSRTWDSADPLPDNWWNYDQITPLRERLKEIVQANLSNNDLWMWKDPRTSLLIPLWLEILKNLRITPLFVICIRNPLDVYHSLEKRNQFSKDIAFRLWNLYTLSSLYWTNNKKRTIVHYDSLFYDIEDTLRKISNELMIPFPQNTDQMFRNINAFIDSDLRHSFSSLDQLLYTEGVPEETKILYVKLIDVLYNPSLDIEKLVKRLYINL